MGEPHQASDGKPRLQRGKNAGASWQIRHPRTITGVLRRCVLDNNGGIEDISEADSVIFRKRGLGYICGWLVLPAAAAGIVFSIGSDNTHVLVDAGISNKRIEMGLNDLGLNARELDGILITHEHSDHIKGLGVLARKYGTPIYSTKETLEEIQDSKSLGEIPEDLMHPITPDVDFMVGDLEVKPFRIDHDAANPVAYRVQNEKRSVAVATDMGHYSQYIIDHLQGLDAILLEANHDVKMLEAGPYPYYLKRRS